MYPFGDINFVVVLRSEFLSLEASHVASDFSYSLRHENVILHLGFPLDCSQMLKFFRTIHCEYCKTMALVAKV